MVQKFTDHEWDELFLKEDDFEKLHADHHIKPKKLSLKEELKELKDFKYDIGKERMEELNKKYE